MPELITHTLVGEKVAQKIKNEDVKSLINENKKEFLLGCQGGDLFFFYNYGVLKDKKSMPKFGDRLHVEHIEEFFKESIEYIKEHSDDKLLAYFLGYLCHYATDKQVHPFVYKKSNHDSTMHHNIEFMMGKQFLNDTKGKKAKDFNLDEIFDFKMSDSILDFYIHIAKKLYAQELDKEMIRKCKKDFCDFKIRTKNPNFGYLVNAKLAKLVLKFDPMALVYKDENNWEYFTQKEYADFVSNVLVTLSYSEKVIECAYNHVKSSGTEEEYLCCFDGTDFCGNKCTAK